MTNLTVPADQWLNELFECEYCAECGGDTPDHDAIPFMGNWFARCKHPLPDDIKDKDIEAEFDRRLARKRTGLPLIG